jgi:predicted dehydrogenase
MEQQDVDRRDFLKTSAAAGAAASALGLSAVAYGQVAGANERLRVAFLGTGGRCQEHIGIITNMARQNRNTVQAVAVCDVWDGNVEVDPPHGRGLRPSAQRCGLDRADNQHVTKDYRRVLDQRDVDVVCIATPDHWHAKMTIDAMAAGKDVYCEKPMTRTIYESHAVVDAARRHNRVMSVGVQSMADPTWRLANERIRRGDIGHVCQAQTSYYRNYIGGQWRYYRLTRDMTPETIDWPMFLGHQFSVERGVPIGPSPRQRPFDRAVYGQWRCYWDFGGGMFTDLFVHQTTHMISAMGVRYPRRVVGAGGIFLEYDGRDVPDVATVVADYEEGCQLIITATMINDYPIQECIRGRLATLNFVNRPRTEGGQPVRRNGRPVMDFGFEILPQNMRSGPGVPRRLENMRGEFVRGGLEGNDTEALWRNFLECVRARRRATLSPPELGAAAFTTVNMGVQSYRNGRALFWDEEQRRPVPADASWARHWEERSHDRGTPNQVANWEGGNSGSVVEPPPYQRLGGPWVNGRDPAAGGNGNPPAAGAARGEQ